MGWREESDDIYEYILRGLAKMLPASEETLADAEHIEDVTIRGKVERFIDEATRD